MSTERNPVRATALCVVLDADRVFVFTAYDSADDEIFYRPLGGGIEFGETGLECVEREILEEINAEVVDGRRLGTLESIFSYSGVPGHQITLVYEARFADAGIYEAEFLVSYEDEGVETSTVPGEEKLSANSFRASWVPLDDFRDGSKTLYPVGLLELIDNSLVTTDRAVGRD